MQIGTAYSSNGTCEFIVWAPFRDTVSLRLLSPSERNLAMLKDRQGYWRVTVQDLEPGTRYLFCLEENTQRPDPASHFQPDGVHGSSVVVSHNDFDWHDHGWQGILLDDMIMYELHVGTFSPEGTFEAIISRLDQLKLLGINAIEIMPVAQFPGARNWGYDGTYLYAVQNSYGGPEGLKRLVDACHAKEIAVILDVVYNHLGPEGNYLSDFGPYFTEKYKTPWGAAVNYDDAHSDHVRNFFVENMLFWFRHYHVDALRLDAVHGIFDMSAMHILKEMASALESLNRETGRECLLIAESDLNDIRVVQDRGLGGYGIDAQWSDDFHHSLHTLLTGEHFGYYSDFGDVEHIAKALREGFVYSWNYSKYRKRYHGSSSASISAHKFVVFSQNHDQVGNRKHGERLSQLVDFESLKLAAGAVLVSPFVPLLFMGEEYGEDAPFLYFVDHSDAGLVEAVREGRKNEFRLFEWKTDPPDPASPETFHTSRLTWENREKGHHKILLDYYNAFIRVRREFPALRQLDKNCLAVDGNEKNKTLTLHRWFGAGAAFCIMNFNTKECVCTLSVPDGDWRKIIDSADRRWYGPGSVLPDIITGTVRHTVPPLSITVYIKDNNGT